MIKPRFSPEINFGHLMQAGVLVVTIGGGALTSYLSLRGDIASSSERFAVAIAGTNARVLVLESRREADERFQTETRRDLGRLLEGMAEVRATQLSTKGKK